VTPFVDTVLANIFWGSLGVLLVDAQIPCHTEELAKCLQENISRSSKRGDCVVLLHDNVQTRTAQRFGTCCKISVWKRLNTSKQYGFGLQRFGHKEKSVVNIKPQIFYLYKTPLLLEIFSQMITKFKY
jgi:hypothetical protein